MEIFGENYWLLISLMAPILWAMVNIVDVYFVNGIYKNEVDGAIIFGLFQFIPCIILPFFIRMNSFIKLMSFQTGSFLLDNILILAILGGFLFTSTFFFYYKVLFKNNDVALLQVFWNLAVIVVPILTFLFLGERLPYYGYIGMIITFFGASLLSFNDKLRTRCSGRNIIIIMGAVLLLSLSMVIAKMVYSNLSNMGYSNQGFLIGFLFFSIGSFLGGIFFIFYGKKNPIPLIKKHYKIFIIAEGLTFLGTLASQRAIDISPSVSYVATVETFVPIFVLIFSFIIIFFSKFIKNKKEIREIIEKIYNKQLDGIWVKIFATIIMAIGILIIS